MQSNDRARQFLSFDALKGLREALKEKEKVYVEKDEVTELDKEILDEVFNSLKVNDMVKITYIDEEMYLVKQGVVSKIDITSRFVKVVKEKIFIDDIVNIEILKNK